MSVVLRLLTAIASLQSVNLRQAMKQGILSSAMPPDVPKVSDKVFGFLLLKLEISPVLRLNLLS